MITTSCLTCVSIDVAMFGIAGGTGVYLCSICGWPRLFNVGTNHVTVTCTNCTSLGVYMCLDNSFRQLIGFPLINSTVSVVADEAVQSIQNIKCPICFKNSEVVKHDDREIQLGCCYINATRSPSAYKEAKKRIDKK